MECSCLASAEFYTVYAGGIFDPFGFSKGNFKVDFYPLHLRGSHFLSSRQSCVATELRACGSYIRCRQQP